MSQTLFLKIIQSVEEAVWLNLLLLHNKDLLFCFNTSFLTSLNALKWQ